MYVSKRFGLSYQWIATIVTAALVLWAIGAHMFTQSAEAANLTYVSDTLSDSNPSSASNHTIVFTTPNGMSSGETFEVTFDALFTNIGSITVADVDVDVNGSASSTAAGAGAGTFGVVVSSPTITFTVGTEGVASSSQIEIRIGTNATGGTNQIVNPNATTSYEIPIGYGASTIQDSGNARVAIIENVLVTADVDTSLTFTVKGTTTAASANCNGAGVVTVDSTNTTIPFGNLDSAGTPEIACQDLTVATNAIHGYVVTVEEDTDFKSSTGAIIDGFANGSYTDTPAAWVAPGNDVLDPTSWGHWGLSSTDGTTTRGAADEFDPDEWVAASTSPRVVMGHDSVADGTTEGIGRASVAYKVQITALQEAGDDYNTTLTYIATPTF